MGNFSRSSVGEQAPRCTAQKTIERVNLKLFTLWEKKRRLSNPFWDPRLVI